MIPDIEALLGDYLRAHPGVVALDARVAGRTPSGQVLPWVRVTQLDASDDAASSREHLIDYLVQLDCYAGKAATDDYAGQAEASLLTRTVRAALKDLQGVTVDGVVVSAVAFTGMLRAPDTDLEPARERYILTTTIHAHA